MLQGSLDSINDESSYTTDEEDEEYDDGEANRTELDEEEEEKVNTPQLNHESSPISPEEGSTEIKRIDVINVKFNE